MNARHRPDGSGADDTKCDSAMPPASRNHRTPTAGDTLAPTAASSLERPAAISAQNRHRAVGRQHGDSYDNALAETVIGLFKTARLCSAGRVRAGLP